MAIEGTKIMKCTCSHDFQDSVYGPGMRVHNVNSKGQAACTVCTPNYQRTKSMPTTPMPASAMLGHGIIMARPQRNLKNA